MENVLQIVPLLHPACSGVGDYALILARRFRDDYGVSTTFAVAHPNPDQTELNGFEVVSLDLDGRLDISNRLRAFTCVFLHFVGYGFQKRGCPFWLQRLLKKWKQDVPELNLVTLFHELYATGLPWQSSFYTSPFQRAITTNIARLSCDIVTNRTESAAKLTRMTGRGGILRLPVFSNVGEPQTRRPISERDPILIVFGSVGWRSQVFGRDYLDLKQACRNWGVEQVFEVGPGLIELPQLEVPCHSLGVLSSFEVSSLMQRARLGFLSYSSAFLEKSGIYAAYSAHGVVTILPQRSMSSKTLGVTAGRHYVSAKNDFNSLGFLEERSCDVFNWYQTHTSAVHADAFAELIVK